MEMLATTISLPDDPNLGIKEKNNGNFLARYTRHITLPNLPKDIKMAYGLQS
jgi:hypothetical protein